MYVCIYYDLLSIIFVAVLIKPSSKTNPWNRFQTCLVFTEGSGWLKWCNLYCPLRALWSSGLTRQFFCSLQGSNAKDRGFETDALQVFFILHAELRKLSCREERKQMTARPRARICARAWEREKERERRGLRTRVEQTGLLEGDGKMKRKSEKRIVERIRERMRRFEEVGKVRSWIKID